jgi:hypothetical protein
MGTQASKSKLIILQKLLAVVQLVSNVIIITVILRDVEAVR